jgi:1-deoxy-D-xylulose-5-phosphate reductoisomerase
VALARSVGESGGCFPAVFNAANEECVEAFLAGRIRFVDIVETVQRVVQDWADDPENETAGLSVDTVLRAEGWARAQARELLHLAPSEAAAPSTRPSDGRGA